MTSSTGNVQLLGSLRRLGDGRGAVCVSDVYATDVNDLWSALTEPARLSRWVAEVTGDLRVGGTVHALFTSSWDGLGRIDVCDAPHRLVVTMDPGTADETVIEATLEAQGDGTRLVVEERGIPLRELTAHGAGWQTHVEDLGRYLDGRKARDWRERVAELRPAYPDLERDLA